MKKYDHIILGTGQATGTLLGGLIPTGDRIAVIEGAQIGGSCVNYGCTPTKTMVASAKAFHQAKRGDFYGFSAQNLSVDFSKVRERMNSVRIASKEGLTSWIESTENVELIRAWGCFADQHTIQVGDQVIEGKHIYINTGTHSFTPPIEGIDQVPYLDNKTLLELEDLPSHLLVLGGGYIGVEFAQVFRRLGSQVTIIQGADQLMPKEDPDVADSVRQILMDEGIQVVCSAKATMVLEEGKQIVLTVKLDGKEERYTGSHLLVATGRRPNSKELGLEAASIETNDRGYIVVDDHCRTNVDGVFAVGDVNGNGAFTHTAVNDGEIVLDHLFGGTRKISDRIPIYALFTDPPLGRVGMSEKEAVDKGYSVLKAEKPMSEISRAKEMGETKGFAKLLVDAKTDLILGASILGPGGDEIINMFAAIMHSKIPCRNYREVVLVHPTVSELMPFILDGIKKVVEKPSQK